MVTFETSLFLSIEVLFGSPYINMLYLLKIDLVSEFNFNALVDQIAMHLNCGKLGISYHLDIQPVRYNIFYFLLK